MRFLPFIAILIVGVGTMLLGAELMTLPQKPAVQQASPPNKLAQHEAGLRAEKAEGDASRPLTPLYPASPGSAKDVRVVYPPTNQTQAANETTEAAPVTKPKTDPKAAAAATASNDAPAAQPQPTQTAEPQQTNVSAPANAQPQSSQPVKTAGAAPKPLQPAVEHTANHCDVQACASAYSSFRAADCTYQPFEGPRRACTAPPAQRSAEHVRRYDAAPAQTRARNEVELRPIESENAAVDDDDDDAAVPLDGRRRVIILDRNYGPWY